MHKIGEELKSLFLVIIAGLIFFGIPGVVYILITGHSPFAGQQSQQSWSCLEWNNQTLSAICANSKYVYCGTLDNTSQVGIICSNGTGIVGLPRGINCPLIATQNITKSTCLREGLNCRNDTLYWSSDYPNGTNWQKASIFEVTYNKTAWGNIHLLNVTSYAQMAIHEKNLGNGLYLGDFVLVKNQTVCDRERSVA